MEGQGLGGRPKGSRSVQFSSHSDLSDTLKPQWLQHANLPSPSPILELAQTHVHWVSDGHPTISSSVIPFSSCLQSFPASASFPMIYSFTSGSQSIGASASASVLPMNTQDWFLLRLTGLISCSPRDSQESSSTPQFKSINSLELSFLYVLTLISIHDYWKNHSFD